MRVRSLLRVAVPRGVEEVIDKRIMQRMPALKKQRHAGMHHQSEMVQLRHIKGITLGLGAADVPQIGLIAEIHPAISQQQELGNLLINQSRPRTTDAADRDALHRRGHVGRVLQQVFVARCDGPDKRS